MLQRVATLKGRRPTVATRPTHRAPRTTKNDGLPDGDIAVHHLAAYQRSVAFHKFFIPFCNNDSMFRGVVLSLFVVSGLVAQPTFHKDVEPIMQAKCQQCHRPNDIAPFSLLTYDDVSTYATDISVQVETSRSEEHTSELQSL